MPVYVDDMQARKGIYVFSHMIATTDEELHAMADAIGVQRKWWQAPPHTSHYDIVQTKRAEAYARGAIAISWREASYLCRIRDSTGVMPSIEEARAYFAERAERFRAIKRGQAALF